ncbi:MAG: TonB-dependent receptor, partial [Solirubrobacteraceae bacterium]
SSIQFSAVSSQLSSANSDLRNNVNDGVSGSIPSYYVADVSTSYKWNKFKLEAGVTNFTNNSYFTRRATGYPGPGIIPSENRMIYATVEFLF